MNMQQLRYFLAVMETGSVSRAAALSSVTQPTMSVALKRLEAEFGSRLFAPDGRGLRALPAAKQLEPHLRTAVRAIADARRELAQDVSRPLRIGLLPSLSPVWLLAISKARTGHVEITEAPAHELNAQVVRARLDLAVTAFAGRSSLPHRVLLREPYRLFVGAAHEFAGKRRVALTDLHRQPFVVRQCCEQLGAGQRLLRAAGVRLNVVAKTRQEVSAATLVAAGIGVTLAPRSWSPPGVQAVEIGDFPLERTVGLVWKTKEAGKAAAELLARLSSAVGLRRLSNGFRGVADQ